MYTSIPKITGPQLIRLLSLDGWEIRRKARHGLVLRKRIAGRLFRTVVSTRPEPLPEGTLSAILRQTGLGKEGLLRLLNKHGLK